MYKFLRLISTGNTFTATVQSVNDFIYPSKIGILRTLGIAFVSSLTQEAFDAFVYTLISIGLSDDPIPLTMVSGKQISHTLTNARVLCDL